MPESPLARVSWRKSSYSGNGGGQCVEISKLAGLLLVRDSKSPDEPVLTLNARNWRTLLDEIKSGALDL